MIRIGVVSDTHRDLRCLEQARQALGKIDWLLHAGDHFQDAPQVAKGLGMDPLRVRAVVGNCDHPVQEPVEELLEIDGVRIWLTHGHHFGVKHGYLRIYYKAKELGARVVVFGHSHLAVAEDDGQVLLFNPGSLSQPRLSYDLPSCGLLEIDNGSVTAHIFRLNG
ncbi:MAG TPA: metallophosphoesterase [Symbiobacteriaceae bacterium]|jgi:hypothetical protein